MVRLYTERRLDFGRAFQDAGGIESAVLRLERNDDWVEEYIGMYAAQGTRLSFRGSVEYAILLGEGGHTNAEKMILWNLIHDSEVLPDRVDEKVVGWVRQNQALNQYIPSNDVRWRSAAATLLSLCGTNTDDVALAAHIQELQELLGPCWQLPVLRQETKAKLGAASVQDLRVLSEDDQITLARRRSHWGLLQVTWWLVMGISLILLWRFRDSTHFYQPSKWACRYFRNWSVLMLISVFVRARTYSWLWEFGTMPIYILILPFWFTCVAYSILAWPFATYYGLGRVMPSFRVIARVFGLTKQSNWRVFAAMTAGIWVLRSVLLFATEKLMPSGSGPEGSLRPELVFNPSVISIICLVISMSVLAPFFEEIFYRGLVYAPLRARFGVGIAMTASAALFSIIHLYGWQGSVSVFLDGLLFAYAFERTGSLLPGMFAHGLINFFSVIHSLISYNPLF